jgi:hypothetical protein
VLKIVLIIVNINKDENNSLISNQFSLKNDLFRNSKKNVLKIVLIIVNTNKDENKSLISNQISLKNNSPPPTSWRTILRR